MNNEIIQTKLNFHSKYFFLSMGFLFGAFAFLPSWLIWLKESQQGNSLEYLIISLICYGFYSIDRKIDNLSNKKDLQKGMTAYLQLLENNDKESGTYYSFNFFVENDIDLIRHNEYSDTEEIIKMFDSINQLFSYIEKES